jgi:hypothetical protein
MFERYTEKARRVIFFARYEASQFGSSKIETEHLLLGLLREDKSLHRWLSKTDTESIRRRIDEHSPKHPPTSTAVDLPLDAAARRSLKYAADEAERLANQHIGTEHLFLGLLEEKDCFAAQLLREAGAEATVMHTYYAEQSQSPKPTSFQRASYRGLGFRALSGETVEIHGARWNVDYVHDAINLVRSCNWHWRKALWKPRDVVIHRKNGAFSFDLSLAQDPANFTLVHQGWKKDYCFICRWEMFESEDEHGTGYTNGHDWLCKDCYERFWADPNFFSSSHSDIT